MTLAYDLSEPYAPEAITDRDPDNVLRYAVQRAPWSLGWDALHWIPLTDKRDALRIYARLGLHPIVLHGVADGRCTCGNPECPDRTRGKHPVRKEWQHAPLDIDAADRLLIAEPRRNLGLRMGKQPDGTRLVTIDVDGERDLLAPLEAEHGPLPPTLTASSGKGYHLIFRLRANVETPKNAVKIAPGVDVRSEGGQIVAAPSLHYSGRVYRWVDAREPAELP